MDLLMALVTGFVWGCGFWLAHYVITRYVG